MGGTGFSIQLKKKGDGSAAELYREVHALIVANIERLAKGKAYAAVTESYLGDTIDDGAGRDHELFFAFREAAGLCQMSAEASHHWFTLFDAALARPIDELLARQGFKRDGKARALAPLLARNASPLVELRGYLFGTGGNRGAPHLISDETDEERIEYENLTAKERAKVDLAMKNRRCDCRVCQALRDKKTKLVLPKPPAKKRAAKPGPRVKTFYEGGAYRSITAPEATAVPLGLLKPPTLEQLTIVAPVESLPEELASLGVLRELTLNGSKLRAIPDVLTRMPSLRRLRFVSGVPEDLSGLAKLPFLEVLEIHADASSSARVAALPFASFPQLKELELHGVGFARLPDGVRALRSLERLELHESPLTELPSWLAELTELRTLDLSGSKLRRLPEALRALKKLSKLTLYGSEVTTLPRWLGELTELRELNCMSAEKLVSVEALPDGLTTLDLNAEGVTALPPLPRKLTSLGLECTSITALPDLPRLLALEVLNLRSTKITALPDKCQLKKLGWLWLSRCTELEALPEWLGELDALEHLHLDNLKITALPASMKRLKKLKALRLDDTAGVFPLPDWFSKLTALEELDCDYVKLPKGEKARLKKLLPKTTIRNRS